MFTAKLSNLLFFSLWTLLIAILPLWHVPLLRKSLIVILFVWALCSNASVVLKSYKQAWPMLLWAGFCTLSWFWSVNPQGTAHHLHHDLLYTLLAFGVFAGAAGQPLSQTWFRFGILLCSVLSAVTAFLGDYIGIAWIDYYYSEVGYSSTIALICIAFSVPLLLRRHQDSVAWIILITSLMVGVYSANRMFFVLLLLLVLCTFCLILRRPFFRKGKTWIVLIFVLVAALFGLWSVENTELFRKFTTIFESGDVRPKMWTAWLDFALRTPFFGTGYGRSVAQYALNGELQETLKTIIPVATTHSHNLFLNIFIETGAIGLILFSVMWLSFLLRFYRQWQNGCATGLQGLAIILFFLAKNITDVFFVDAVMVLVFGLIGYLPNADSSSEKTVKR